MQTTIRGTVHWRLTRPDGSTVEGETHNLVTDIGDQVIASKYHGTSIQAPTGMRLGTGTTNPSKNGAGAAMVTYITASSQVLDSGYPTVATKGAGLGWRATYRVTYAAGTATNSAIAEVVLTNEASVTNVAGTAANTVARALISPVINKASGDILEMTWYHDILGA